MNAADENIEQLMSLLSDHEQVKYRQYAYPQKARQYLLGRVCAKQAIQSLTPNQTLNYKDVSILSGAFQQPVVTTNISNLHVSISHTKELTVALASWEHAPYCIDIEPIERRNLSTDVPVTIQEQDLINKQNIPIDLGILTLWTAKEALVKCLKTGLNINYDLLEVSSIAMTGNNHLVVTYKHFPFFVTDCAILTKHIMSICRHNSMPVPKSILSDPLNHVARPRYPICSTKKQR